MLYAVYRVLYASDTLCPDTFYPNTFLSQTPFVPNTLCP